MNRTIKAAKSDRQGTKHKSEKERRVQILQAAMTCFATKGYHSTTMKELVEKSQLSKGAIYHYFDSKESILVGLIEHWDIEIGQELETIAQQHDSINGLKAFCLSNLEFFMEYKRLSYAFYELKDNPYIANLIKKSMYTSIHQTKTLLTNTGYSEERANLTTEQAALAVLSLFEGLYNMFIIDESLDRQTEFEKLWPVVEKIISG